MKRLTILFVLTLLALPGRALAGEFPELDLSMRWSTVGAFESEFDFFSDRHYSDRINPEFGVHLLPFMTVTGEYAFSRMERTTGLVGSDSSSPSMDTVLMTHTVAVGVRFHPKWRGVLLPFVRVVGGISRATVTFDASEGGAYGYWSESATRPELTLSGGTEILFPRGVRARSSRALAGKASRAAQNATIGLVLEAGHVFAPAYDLGMLGGLGIGEFTFEAGFVVHF